jgi:hypothetical protein
MTSGNCSELHTKWEAAKAAYDRAVANEAGAGAIADAKAKKEKLGVLLAECLKANEEKDQEEDD